MSLPERFLLHIRELPNGCLEWLGTVHQNGYGRIWVDGRRRPAHHVAYYLHYGEWPPEGYETDHICHPNTCTLGVKCPHRRCVNWEHLKLVPKHKENNGTDRSAVGLVNAARQQAKTHCPKGHEYTPDNTRYQKKPTGTLGRKCLECHRVRSMERYHRRGVGPAGPDPDLLAERRSE